jgi:hypothetical protein
MSDDQTDYADAVANADDDDTDPAATDQPAPAPSISSSSGSSSWGGWFVSFMNAILPTSVTAELLGDATVAAMNTTPDNPTGAPTSVALGTPVIPSPQTSSGGTSSGSSTWTSWLASLLPSWAGGSGGSTPGVNVNVNLPTWVPWAIGGALALGILYVLRPYVSLLAWLVT